MTDRLRWTEERKNQLRLCARRGLTMRQAATELSATQHAVGCAAARFKVRFRGYFDLDTKTINRVRRAASRAKFIVDRLTRKGAAL